MAGGKLAAPGIGVQHAGMCLFASWHNYPDAQSSACAFLVESVCNVQVPNAHPCTGSCPKTAQTRHRECKCRREAPADTDAPAVLAVLV